MFERFTDGARRVVVVSQEEARALKHSYIGTEHILLGLIREEDGVAGSVLKSLGISAGAAREEITGIVGAGRAGPAEAGHIPFTPRAKKVLELSLRESLQLGHQHIGSEHILLGIIREGRGVAAQVLVRLGANLDRVRQQVVQLAEAAPEPEISRASSGLEPPWAVHLHARSGQIADRLTSIEGKLASIEGRLASVEDGVTTVQRQLAGMTRGQQVQASEPGEPDDGSSDAADTSAGSSDSDGPSPATAS